MKRAAWLLLLVIPLQPASNIDRLPTARKMEMIEKGKVDPGSHVAFSEAELNTYFAQKVREAVPDGMKDTRVQIGDGGVITGQARVDFVKMKRAQGQDMGWIMRQMLEGEHDLRVVGRLETSAGRGRVDLQRVDVGSMAFKGRALDMLINTFLAPHYPQAKPGQSFELGYNMDRIDLKPGQALVVMAPKKQPSRRAGAPVRRSAEVPASRPTPAQ